MTCRNMGSSNVLFIKMNDHLVSWDFYQLWELSINEYKKQTNTQLIIISIRLLKNSQPCINVLKNDLGQSINASVSTLLQRELCKMNKFI